MNWFKRKLTELQNSSPARKLRWVIGLSAISMLVVLFIWVLNVGSIVNLNRPSRVFSLSNPDGADKDGALFKLRQRTAQSILFVQSKLSQENQIDIELPDNPKNNPVEELPKKKKLKLLK